MVRHHVAHSPDIIEVAPTPFDTDSLGIGDLHVIDIVTVPKRLKNAVTEAEDEQVLHCLFAEIMIDAIDLIFGEHALNLRIQSLRRFQIVSERLLDDHATPASVLLLRQIVASQSLNDLSKEFWSGCQIKKIVSLSSTTGIDFAELPGQAKVGVVVSKIAALIVKAFVEPAPCFAGVVFLIEKLSNVFAECIRTEVVDGNADHGEVSRQQFVFREVEECRDQLAFGEIACSPKDHHYAWTRRLVGRSELVFQVGYRCRRHLASQDRESIVNLHQVLHGCTLLVSGASCGGSKKIAFPLAAMPSRHKQSENDCQRSG